MALTESDRRILEFEGSWWTRPGTKAESIRSELGMGPGLYYRRLSCLVDDDEAKALAPMVVLRLRRQRSERRKGRFEGFAEPDHPRR